MEHPFLTLFRPILATHDKREAIAYLLQHPVLMSPHYTNLLRQWAAAHGPSERPHTENAVALASDTWRRVSAGEYEASVHQVVADLASQVVSGTMTEEHACKLASRPENFVELLYPVITFTCDLAEQVMVSNWRRAVMLMRILLAALDARGKVIPENQQAMVLTATESWLAVARVACNDIPDGRIFFDAVARAEPLADLNAGSDPPAPIMHRLGTLHLDAYVGGRSVDNISVQISAWQRRLHEEYGSQLAGVPESKLIMPPIGEALTQAAGYLRRAAARRSGIPRGQSLKALAQALEWHKHLGLPFDPDEQESVVREALELLPLAQFPAVHAELCKILSTLEEGPSVTERETILRARQILGTPVEKWLKTLDPISTIDLFYTNASTVQKSDPHLALKLWMAVDDLIRSQPEARRSEHDRSLLRLATRALAPGAPRADGTPIADKLQKLRITAQSESWPQNRLVYSLVRLAASTSQTDQEDSGLDVLEYATSLVPEYGTDPILRRVLPVLRAMLETGVAVNAVNALQFARAAIHYRDALSSNLEAHQPSGAFDMVRRMLDLARPGKPESEVALRTLALALFKNALSLEQQGAEAATALIQRICRFAFPLFLREIESNAAGLFLVLDIAKGRRFRAALAHPGCAQPWLNHPHTLAVERQILDLRKRKGAETTVRQSAFDENMLLSAYVTAKERSGGTDVAEQLRNLEIEFDRNLERQLGGGWEDDWLPTLSELQSHLDEQSVLLIHYLAENGVGVQVLYVLLVSDTNCFVGQTIFHGTPSADLILSDREESITTNMLSFSIGELRDRIVSPPGPRAVDLRAMKILEKDYKTYLAGDLTERLHDLNVAGKKHLSVCPHGPLHFYPLHLLGPEDRPLANSWCVTYIPHLRLLSRERIQSDKRVQLTCIGRNFETDNEFGLDELIDGEDEAEAIAHSFGTESHVLIGKSANEKAVRAALERSSRVHFSTHGKHNASAPAFQCIFVYPDKSDDGVIHAYELMRMDLRGLDLVTLSACETALGRFDVADNLRGIPEALLLAGVSTIVGTLWNIRSETAKLFFTTFYENLKQRADKREAFYKAQIVTRREYPAYRDWGAFQFIGSWT